MSRPSRTGTRADQSVEVHLTRAEKAAFLTAAKEAGFLRPGMDIGAVGAWLRALGLAALSKKAVAGTQ